MHVVAREEIDPPRRTMLAADPEQMTLQRLLAEATRRDTTRRSPSGAARWRAQWRAAGAAYTEVVTDEPTPHAVRRIAEPPVVRSAGAVTWLIPSAIAIAAVASLVGDRAALHRAKPAGRRAVADGAIHSRTSDSCADEIARAHRRGLLLLRVLAIMLLGVAVAAPLFPSGTRVARIVIADRSRAVANVASRARQRSRVSPRRRRVDRLRLRRRTRQAPSALDSLAVSGARGSLSAALAAAIRAAARVAPRTDSIEMVLVSPLADEEIDDATARIRATWPGRIRVVRVAAATAPSAHGRARGARAAPNDAVAAGLSLRADECFVIAGSCRSRARPPPKTRRGRARRARSGALAGERLER